MCDLSNWNTTGFETYLTNPAQELPENIKDEGTRTTEEGVRTKSVYIPILGATSDQLVTAGLNHADDSGVDGERYFNSYGHCIDPKDPHIKEELRSIMLFGHKGIKTAQDAILGIIQDECDPSGYNLRGRIKGTAALRALKITLRNKIIWDAGELEAMSTSLLNRDVRTLEELLKHEQEVILVQYALGIHNDTQDLATFTPGTAEKIIRGLKESFKRNNPPMNPNLRTNCIRVIDEATNNRRTHGATLSYSGVIEKLALEFSSAEAETPVPALPTPATFVGLAVPAPDRYLDSAQWSKPPSSPATFPAARTSTRTAHGRTTIAPIRRSQLISQLLPPR